MKILVSDQLSDEGLKILKDIKEFQVDVKTGMKPEELKSIIKDYDALLVRSSTKVTKDIIASADNMKVIGRAGVGLDNVDLEAATQKGIIVMNTPGGNTISTAELAWSMLMSTARNIPQACASLKAGEWQRNKFMGVELYKKDLGIIGLGRIGREVAKRALSFGMQVLAFDPFLSKEVAESLGVEIVDLETLLKRSDFITVHTPGGSETKHLIAEKEFAMMKDGVKIINCARGGIISETALAQAIKSGKVSGAALDVFEKEPPAADLELLKLDKVVVTPHLGASTEEAQVNVAVEVAEIVRDALLGKGIRNAANYPVVEAEAYRILKPYIELAERLGMFACQLAEGRIHEVKITYSGDIIQQDIAPIAMALVKGLLTPILQDTVNYINAIAMAKERGIKLQETRLAQEEDFVNLITLDIKTDKGSNSVAGTLSANKQPRIVKIDGYYVEASPSGYMIVGHNWDKPGIIGSVGALMGKHNINIAAMTFGRKIQGGEAISVLNVDSPISDDLLNQLRKLENILSAKVIKL